MLILIIDKELIEEFLSLVKLFRKKANSKAHSLFYFVENKEELIGLSSVKNG